MRFWAYARSRQSTLFATTPPRVKNDKRRTSARVNTSASACAVTSTPLRLCSRLLDASACADSSPSHPRRHFRAMAEPMVDPLPAFDNVQELVQTARELLTIFDKRHQEVKLDKDTLRLQLFIQAYDNNSNFRAPVDATDPHYAANKHKAAVKQFFYKTKPFWALPHIAATRTPQATQPAPRRLTFRPQPAPSAPATPPTVIPAEGTPLESLPLEVLLRMVRQLSITRPLPRLPPHVLQLTPSSPCL